MCSTWPAIDGEKELTESRNLATPHSIIWEYYECLRRQINRIPENENDRTQKQELFLALILSVSVVEAFINAFFRVVVEEEGFSIHKDRLLKDVEDRISLERKLKEWPKMVFGKRLDFHAPNVKMFVNLKNQRNALMHFVSSHESIELPGPVNIRGMADMSALKALSLSLAVDYPNVIRNFSYEIFLARGISGRKLPHAFHQWFGEPPSKKAPHLTSYVGWWARSLYCLQSIKSTMLTQKIDSQDLLGELKALLAGRGLQPNSILPSVLATYEGCHLQKSAWRNFLFVGEQDIEIVHNKGNWKNDRIVIPYSTVKEIYMADFDNGIPRDVIFLGENEEELGRFSDADPSKVDEILAILASATNSSNGTPVMIHRMDFLNVHN